MLQTINCLLLFSALSLEVATGQESWKDRPAVDPSLRVISRSQLVEKKGLLHLKGEKNPFSGIATGWIGVDEDMKELTIKNGLHDGVQKYWTGDGHPVFVFTMREGKDHGIHTSWHYDGGISNICYYQNGKRHGLSRSFYRDGKLEHIGSYDKDIRIGTHTKLHPNGRIEWIVSFMRDEIHGPFLKWKADGSLASAQYYWYGKEVTEEEWQGNLEEKKPNKAEMATPKQPSD